MTISSMPAEMAARLTMARAIAADYAREAAEDRRPDWFAWSARLHTALTGLMAALAPRIDGSVGESSFVACDGSGILTPADVLNVLSALADAAVYRSTHAEDRDLADVAAYRALSRALGDDR